ncbi:PIG-L family deacetylase [Actinoplanes sp. NPDC049548]|uniref:PIG-L family deacetylase n=1 Tax=Actinoplanes sp. NPDC049548 TaxID=3155152 RepID=UPI0034487C5C
MTSFTERIRRMAGRTLEQPEEGWEPGTVMSIVAHPDDDLYFLNPGISVAIGAGVPVVGVVLTSAEGDGRNVDTNDPGRNETPVDHAGYATARQVGLRRAYARMAGLPVASPWKQELVTLASGLAVARAHLEARPEVVLYFFNAAHREIDGKRRTSLLPLYDGTMDRLFTMAALDTPADPQLVTRCLLVASLVDVIEAHRPAVIRTMDPDPEHDWGREDFVVSDHADHTATARFAIEAVSAVSRTSSAPPVVEYYRAYANRYWPANLSPRSHDEKAQYLATYAGADGEPKPELPYGHGDYQLGTDPYRSSHMYSMAERYVPRSTWLTRLPSGALAAFAVLGDRLAVWHESAPGSDRWQGPHLSAESGFMPHPAVAAGRTGPVHVVAMRRTDVRTSAEVELGHFTVDGTGRLSGWQSLAGPDTAHFDRRRQREVGAPAATVDGDGDLWVFARGFSGRMAFRRQAGGEWQPWESLGGILLQDVAAAATTEDGLVRVFAAGKHSVMHWRQQKHGGPLEPDDSLKTAPVASGGLHVAFTAGDRACLFFRRGFRPGDGVGKDETGRVQAYREHAVPGTWPGRSRDLGDTDGVGPVAVLGRSDAGAADLVMAQRDGSWTVRVSVPPASPDGASWRPLPGMISGGPALAADVTGRAVLAVIGLDGRLHVRRQSEADPSSRFGPWTTV